MPRGNHIIPNGHFRKSNWQLHVRTWFNQPGRKLRRRLTRERKAVRIFPRPVDGPVRPLVHPPTVRYNRRLRLGRGFTAAELKAAKFNPNEAPAIGIAVDRRRRNHSHKSFWTNVQRLKEYRSRLVVFPRNPKKPSKAHNEVSVEEFKKAEQLHTDLLPVSHPVPSFELVDKKAVNFTTRAYDTLRQARADARLIGKRKVWAKKRAEKEQRTAKKADKAEKA